MPDPREQVLQEGARVDYMVCRGCGDPLRHELQNVCDACQADLEDVGEEGPDV